MKESFGDCEEYLTLARWQAEGVIAGRHTTTVFVILRINEYLIGR